ncbi:U-box domain-containing protein 5-like [Dorcoceras hygrometricum]|uniref:RING-type E3 ubiquitin transferase n=1 Tax=Dorcoceras hygrometricum TaxID=472368 RepID=A0A2Z7DD94_9LAMI|nr:U-box domain-containing protein 5-like [Dorcoceras hygrometricum]
MFRIAKLVIIVTKIFPEIEAARPGCLSGIEALCLLKNGIVTAKSLLQHCSESSVLYLALTGDSIVSKCKKLRNLLEQSLGEIQNMVPVELAAKISGIIADLRTAAFCLDPPEEEAGKLLRELLHSYGSTVDSTEDAAISVVQSVSSWLHITSKKALSIERRSIRKLLDKFGESEPSKRKILLIFLTLLNKYGKFVADEQKHNGLAEHEEPPSPASPYSISGESEFHPDFRSNEAQFDMFSSPVLPDEFICPLTSRLMYDPVTIVSGHTYERTWIQKWFDEGNDTCPKTNMKLEHFSFTSNTIIKEKISKWCATHEVLIHEPEIPDTSVKPLEVSANSLTSLSSSMNDLNLPFEFRNLSCKSSLTSCPSHVEVLGSVKSSHEINVAFFAKFSSLPWDYQCNAVEVVRRLYETNYASWSMIPLEEFIQLLLRFLKDASDFCDMEAQISGCMVLLEFLQKDRNSMLYLDEDSYGILASFLDTKAVKQGLTLFEALSFHQHSGSKFAASGALVRILNILESPSDELLEPALKILNNLSNNSDLCSSITPSEIITKLVRLIENDTLTRYCIFMLKNLCNIEDARVSIAETIGCISAVAKLLENESLDIQECAVSVLHSLCTKHASYRELVVNEDVVPGLFDVSMNGNERSKALASEILRIPGE